MYRLPLPLPGDGLRAVNVYLLVHGGAVSMVDAGWHRPESTRALRDGLGAIGAEVGDVRRVLVTHVHHHHYGQAPAIREASGAVIALGRGERLSMHVINHRRREAVDHDRRRLLALGAAELLCELGGNGFLENREGPWGEPDQWVDDRETLDLAGRRLTAIETPGHTRGHVSYLDKAGGLLFSGDHVLPHITPSIGHEPFSGGYPLLDFLLSLLRVRDLAAELILPAHGRPFTGLAQRVDELLAHHADRLAASLDAVRAGASTALEVAERLPWTRRHRDYGDLDAANRFLAVGETQAHLDLLALHGPLAAAVRDGIRTYTVVA